MHLGHHPPAAGQQRARGQRHEVALEFLADDDVETAAQRPHRHLGRALRELEPPPAAQAMHGDAALASELEEGVGRPTDHPREHFDRVPTPEEPVDLAQQAPLEAAVAQPGRNEQDAGPISTRHRTPQVRVEDGSVGRSPTCDQTTVASMHR